MAQLPKEELARYAHSPVHLAVASRDHTGLRRIIAGLPQLAQAGTIHTEQDSIAEEQRAEALSKEVDRRDVPGRETPLHLTVRMRDVVAAETLLSAGADPNLQNEQGWSALQEAICAQEEAIACLIARYYLPMAWSKWCRRMPRVVATMKRMRDFYMEVTFHFESSVIPFIGKVAPSDTYRIWKKGSNLRADMTIAGFDGFKIKRADQSILFLGEGNNAKKLRPGSLCMLKHKRRCVFNALDGADKRPTESEAAREVAELSKTNMYRPGLDVTQAVLMPQLTWRRQERSEMIGKWKAKAYDMHHVQLSLKSRRVPGALTDEELFNSGEFGVKNGMVSECVAELLDEEERRQLDKVLDMQSEEEDDGVFHDAVPNISEEKVSSRISVPGTDIDLKCDRQQTERDPNVESAEVDNDDYYDTMQTLNEVVSRPIHANDAACVSSACVADCNTNRDKKGWMGSKQKETPPRMSYSNDEKVSNLFGDDRKVTGGPQRGRMSVDTPPSNFCLEDSTECSKDKKNRVAASTNGSTKESEYTMGVRPVLWLTPNFPLTTEEMIPLLDILANKVKAVRRLREVLTTKLPAGTFPVKLAIPVVPTIRVIVTFTKFEPLTGNEGFAPPAKGKENDHHGSSWFSWRRGVSSKVVEPPGISKALLKEAFDPFAIPGDYAWIGHGAKKKHGKAS